MTAFVNMLLDYGWKMVVRLTKTPLTSAQQYTHTQANSYHKHIHKAHPDVVCDYLASGLEGNWPNGVKHLLLGLCGSHSQEEALK